MMDENLGEALDECIKRTGLNGSEFALHCVKLDGSRAHPSVISRLRRGRGLPSWETAMAIVAALNRLRCYSFDLEVDSLWPADDLHVRRG